MASAKCQHTKILAHESFRTLWMFYGSYFFIFSLIYFISLPRRRVMCVCRSNHAPYHDWSLKPAHYLFSKIKQDDAERRGGGGRCMFLSNKARLSKVFKYSQHFLVKVLALQNLLSGFLMDCSLNGDRL